MGCKECGKPKCNGECGCKSPKVLQINNPAEYITFHKVSIPAAMGDSTTNPPKIGAYRNALVYYEADHTSWMYSTDGIPTKLTNGLTDYNEAVNLPQINGHTLIGNQSSSDLGLQGELTAGANIQINGNTISATDTTYTAGNGIELDDTEIKAKIGDGLEFSNNGEINIANIEQYAHFFDTVAEMQAATSLIAGSYAKTLGYYAANDGGGSFYKIKNTTDVVDNGSVIDLDSGLQAHLITDEETSVKQFGAKGDGITDDLQAFTNMLATLGHIFVTEGTYSISGTITLHSNEYICGSDKNSCVISYTGNGNCITNEDVSTSKNISIHDLTLVGNNRTGRGIYLVRSVKDGDSYHRLYNLKVSSFDYGIFLEKNLNETQLSDIVTSSNESGLYLSYVNDFYIERFVSCVNRKNGILIDNSTEGRISNTKAWYNGNDNPSSYYNIVISGCTGLMMTNIGCQESYGSNMRVTYSKQISITNCFLSLPCLDNQEHYQLTLNGVRQSNIDVITSNKKVSGDYINKLLIVENNTRECDIKISAEDDFPSNRFIQYPDNATSYGVPIKNNIEFDAGGNKIDKINFITNGDLSVLNSTSDFANFISGSTSACSIVNGKLRVDASGSNAGINFRYPELPVKGLFVFYVAFKKVSDSGKVVVNYKGQKSFNTSTDSDEILIAATYMYKDNYNAATNLRVDVSNAGVIDILEVGFIAGGCGKLFSPLYKKSKIAS